MKLWLPIGLALTCGCATTSSQLVAQNDDAKETKCRLIGSRFEYDIHSTVRDETQTPGPTKVIWLHPPDTTIIRTDDGLFYRCEGRL